MVNLKKEQQAALDKLKHDVTDYRKQVERLEQQMKAAKAVLRTKMLRKVVDALTGYKLPISKVYSEAFGYTQVNALRAALGLGAVGPFLELAQAALTVQPLKVGEEDAEAVELMLDTTDAPSYRRLSTDKNYEAEVRYGDMEFVFTVYDWDDVREVYYTDDHKTIPQEVLDTLQDNIDNLHFAWESYD